MNILVLNAGSSSHKSHLYQLGDSPLAADQSSQGPSQAPPQAPLWEAQIDWQQSPPLLTAKGNGETVKHELPEGDRAEAVARMLHTLHQGETAVLRKLKEIDVVGHRVVHGGQDYQHSVWIDEGVRGAIADLIPLAPSHNPANLEGIQTVDKLLGDIPQYAVFDTAFHHQIPDVAALYPIPQAWTDLGIRRYGFHGISHQYCAYRAAQLLNRPLPDLRLVIAHLGNGCSLSAVRNGHSVDTSMGFTPMEGLMMGTRSGSIDPGILLYLMREQGYTYEQLDHQLNKASGLKGVSGLSGDMRQLQSAIQQGNANAKLAVDMFIYHLTASIAAMTASLNGLDALVFSGGMGANASLIHQRVGESLAFLGIEFLQARDLEDQGDRIISTPNSLCSVLVIHTQEEWQIAQEYWSLNSSQ